MRVADRGCRMRVAGCRCRLPINTEALHLGKVKKIRNLGCSCPGSDLFFLSRDSDRG